jgi:hypothetical protein
MKLEWKNTTLQYSNDETLYLVPNDETLHFGSWIVGRIRHDSSQAVEGIWYKSYSENDEMKNESICKLPGVVERRYFPTVSEAKAAVESAAKYWLSQLSDIPQKT